MAVADRKVAVAMRLLSEARHLNLMCKGDTVKDVAHPACQALACMATVVVACSLPQKWKAESLHVQIREEDIRFSAAGSIATGPCPIELTP
ncbi:hypothetical protein NDU88_009712 [Pleurodeles waltl]|uniref:Uncharacterized protein n=1 Tax=Pleurodeles waltl TaxID=8319 RepID=A0AAV7Q057_PLEWA|nr:hypothetical protein NDU88_009712 [Pleurodeles waltl]